MVGVALSEFVSPKGFSVSTTNSPRNRKGGTEKLSRVAALVLVWPEQETANQATAHAHATFKFMRTDALPFSQVP